MPEVEDSGDADMARPVALQVKRGFPVDHIVKRDCIYCSGR